MHAVIISPLLHYCNSSTRCSLGYKIKSNRIRSSCSRDSEAIPRPLFYSPPTLARMFLNHTGNCKPLNYFTPYRFFLCRKPDKTQWIQRSLNSPICLHQIVLKSNALGNHRLCMDRLFLEIEKKPLTSNLCRNK